MTMNKIKTILFLSPAVLSMGCQQRGPYDVGLLVKATAIVESVTKSYREVPGNGAQESMGVIGSGENCSDAMFSAGKSTETWAGEHQMNMEVVGETLVPRLVPDDTHEQEDVWVSLVMESTRTGGSVLSSVKYNFPGGDPESVTEESYSDDEITTNVQYYGVTAEEYVAAFALDTLWPDDDAGLDPGAAQLLTKNDPKNGDVWFSQSGQSIYMFDTMEDMSVSGTNLKVAKVLVYETGDVDVTEGILKTCINKGRDQYSVSTPGGDYDDQVALLDVGCDDSFRHVQTGTQWWFNGILVKEEVENVDVTITDFGWEWYEDTEFSCSRMTNSHRPDEDAELYLEYEVTTSTVVREATDWIQP